MFNDILLESQFSYSNLDTIIESTNREFRKTIIECSIATILEAATDDETKKKAAEGVFNRIRAKAIEVFEKFKKIIIAIFNKIVEIAKKITAKITGDMSTKVVEAPEHINNAPKVMDDITQATSALLKMNQDYVRRLVMSDEYDKREEEFKGFIAPLNKYNGKDKSNLIVEYLGEDKQIKGINAEMLKQVLEKAKGFNAEILKLHPNFENTFTNRLQESVGFVGSTRVTRLISYYMDNYIAIIDLYYKLSSKIIRVLKNLGAITYEQATKSMDDTRLTH